MVLESVLGVDFYLEVMLEIGGMSFFEFEDSIGAGASDTRLTFEPQETTSLCQRCNKCKCKMSLSRIGMICKHRTISGAEGLVCVSYINITFLGVMALFQRCLVCFCP